MKINKEEALVLAKLIHPHVSFSVTADATLSDFQDVLRDLDVRLTELLTRDDGSDDDEMVDNQKVDELGEDDVDEEDVIDEDEDESEEEDDEETHEEAQYEIEGDELHDLCSIAAYAGARPTRGEKPVTVEFESEFEECRLVSSDGTILVIDSIKRLAKALQVWCTDSSVATTFRVKRFPKEWVDALPVNELVSVV